MSLLSLNAKVGVKLMIGNTIEQEFTIGTGKPMVRDLNRKAV